MLTKDGYARNTRLGDSLADGIQAIIDEAGLPWHAQHLTSRAGWLVGTREPVNGSEAVAMMDVDLADCRRLFMANRGIWEAIVTGGSGRLVRHDRGRYRPLSRGRARLGQGH